MPRWHAIAEAIERAEQALRLLQALLRANLAKLILSGAIEILRVYRLLGGAARRMQLHLGLQKLGGLLQRQSPLRVLASHGRVESLLVTPLPADGESLPSIRLRNRLIQISLEIIDLRLESDDPRIIWVHFNPDCWTGDDG